ncbi:MAG TPA: helix-turn-helix transcriptional regulator [Thermoanaerobaculia bacterium]|nr:helix-turn-helix transcriptional regulator [Thermoanaerobaculia bacterium]
MHGKDDIPEGSLLARAIRRALGRRIAALRGERGLDRAELARRIGVHPDSLARYEQGGSGIPLGRLYRIASALEVEVTALVPRPRHRKRAPSGGGEDRR